MEFKRLRTSNHDMYEKAIGLYKNSFPVHEQRAPGSQIRIMGNEEYHFNLIYDQAVWTGLLLYWETKDFIYVEHFCILPQLRGKKYGKKALELLNAAGKPVILEIDPPVDDVSIGRKSFYERAGYRENAFPHIHPPYSKEFKGHNLVVMSFPDPLSETEYTAFNSYLGAVVMGS